jgi:hypothetical protein
MDHQQMSLFVEDVSNAQPVQPLHPDELTASFFYEESDDEVVCIGIEQLLKSAREYGAKLGKLRYAGTMTDAVMDASLIAFVEGIHTVHRLDPCEHEQLRTEAFVAAFKQGLQTPAEDD